MMGLVSRVLKDKKFSFSIFTVASLVFLEMYIALFPAIQKQGAELTKLMETYPDTFFKAFNIDKASLVFTDIAPYLAMEMFNFIWPILVIIMGISLANYFIAGEVEKGTIEILLSQPISRAKLFLLRYSTGLGIFILFSLITIFAIIPFSLLHNVDYNFQNIAALALASFLFALSVYSLAVMFASFVSEKSKSSFMTGGLLILMYVLNLLAGLKDSLSFLKYFSLFYYYNPTMALSQGRFVEWSILVFIAITLVTTIIGLMYFKRRDIAV